MMLKIQSRTGSRLILAGLLAAVSGTAFAQTPGSKPGTMAAAQAQSQTAPPPAPPPPIAGGAAGAAGAPPSPQAAGPRAPRAPRQRPADRPGAEPGATLATGPVTPAQPEGRLRPRIILPDGPTSNPGQMPGLNGMPSLYGQGGIPPGQMNMPQHSPQAPTGPRDPFAPASAQPSATAAMPTQVPAISPAAKSAADRAKKGGPTAPSINLACTTPDIKVQGVFVGKIQNRYVYKYKSQYCFDIEP